MTTTTAPPAGAQTGTPQPARRRKRGKRSPGEGRMAAMLLSPTILVLALVIVYPLLSAVHQSLFRAESGLDADGFVSDVETFVGLANYADLFVGESGRRFLNAFANTTFFTVTTVFLETVLGLCLAHEGFHIGDEAVRVQAGFGAEQGLVHRGEQRVHNHQGQHQEGGGEQHRGHAAFAGGAFAAFAGPGWLGRAGLRAGGRGGRRRHAGT